MTPAHGLLRDPQTPWPLNRGGGSPALTGGRTSAVSRSPGRGSSYAAGPITPIVWGRSANRAPRIPRDKAAAALTALLETICVGGRHADCVTGVYMFGSFARGALVVGDVDVDIEYDAKLDDAVERELVDNLVTGRDWNTPFRKALKPARALQVMFNKLEMVAAPVLVYQRGDRLADAVARVEAITPDPAAGRAERDPAHPAVEPVAEDLARPSRILLSELAAADLLADRVRRPCRCRRRGHRGRRVPQARAAALDASLEPARPIRSCRWPPPRGPGGRSAHASC